MANLRWVALIATRAPGGGRRRAGLALAVLAVLVSACAGAQAPDVAPTSVGAATDEVVDGGLNRLAAAIEEGLECPELRDLVTDLELDGAAADAAERLLADAGCAGRAAAGGAAGPVSEAADDAVEADDTGEFVPSPPPSTVAEAGEPCQIQPGQPVAAAGPAGPAVEMPFTSPPSLGGFEEPVSSVDLLIHWGDGTSDEVTAAGGNLDFTERHTYPEGASGHTVTVLVAGAGGTTESFEGPPRVTENRDCVVHAEFSVELP